ncbi:MAG: hypothetical protein QHH14_03810 [Clostridiales bacterium]|nr:hypothetical protein [Clostridiales bacterium]
MRAASREYGYLQPIIKERADRIIDHLKLTFVASRPRPPHIVYQEFLMAAEAVGEYFS